MGGEVIDKIGRGENRSAPKQTSLAKSCFLVLGLSFRKRGKLPERLRKEKREADSKTANLILGESMG